MTDDREAIDRGRYLSRAHPELRDDVALAVAYRELGYTASGIARQETIDVSEGTVRGWLNQVAVRHGLQAVETKWRDQRRGPLGTPTTDELIEEHHPLVLGNFLELAQANPEHVPETVDPIALEERIEEYLRGVDPDDVDLDWLSSLLGGWFG